MKYLRKRIKYYKKVISNYNIKINKLKNVDNKIRLIELKIKLIESKFSESVTSNQLKENDEYIFLNESLKKLKQIDNQSSLLELKKVECEKQKNKLEFELKNSNILNILEKKSNKTKANPGQNLVKKYKNICSYALLK